MDSESPTYLKPMELMYPASNTMAFYTGGDLLIFGIFLCLYFHNGCGYDGDPLAVLQCTVDTGEGHTAIRYCSEGCCGLYLYNNRRCCLEETRETQTQSSLLTVVYVAVGLFVVTMVTVIVCCCVHSRGTVTPTDNMTIHISTVQSRLNAPPSVRREHIPSFPPTPFRFTESSVPSAPPVDSFMPYANTVT